jgi:myo-inositol-1(or 4)-monophosphatase
VNHLEAAEAAAREAGALLRRNFHRDKDIDDVQHHDVKLALDRESQDLITRVLLDAFPGHAIYGEEGLAGDQDSPFHWIVDPIDGTVNYLYGIPHFCISIALREDEEIVLGLIYDPMLDELWTVEKGRLPQLNGIATSASARTRLEESILFVGCGKDEEALRTGLARFGRASLRARKMRMMGSAALGLAYIACGRLDAYLESRISLWDVAAGIILVEAAGGKVDLTPHPTDPDVWSIVATNGKIPIEEIL